MPVIENVIPNTCTHEPTYLSTKFIQYDFDFIFILQSAIEALTFFGHRKTFGAGQAIKDNVRDIHLSSDDEQEK